MIAVRTFWKGYLKLSLVTCPVAMLPATSEEGAVRFHTLNKSTGNRVESRYVDAVTGKPVEEHDQVKGYQRGEDDYIMLEDSELDAIALESTRTIDIDRFVPKASIDWIWYDQPYYLFPNDKVGAEAFAVIREAMNETQVLGLARLVLHRREHAVMLKPRGAGILLWTLRFQDEIRKRSDYFSAIPDLEPAPDSITMTRRLIEDHIEPWSGSLMEDPVRERLLSIISAKKKGHGSPKPKRQSSEGGNVIDIMDALRKSLRAKPVR